MVRAKISVQTFLTLMIICGAILSSIVPSEARSYPPVPPSPPPPRPNVCPACACCTPAPPGVCCSCCRGPPIEAPSIPRPVT
ncbi:unnamed protein product [Amaranthus hypochondriacus]